MSIRARRARGRGRAQTVIDITSLLDVVFLLIIFLIVTTTFRKNEHAFVVELPTSGTEVVEVTEQAQENPFLVSETGSPVPYGMIAVLRARDSKKSALSTPLQQPTEVQDHDRPPRH